MSRLSYDDLIDEMSMTGAINLTDRIEKKLPAEMVDFLRQAGEAAQRRGQRLYLVVCKLLKSMSWEVSVNIIELD